jgi:hypothetical protein
MKYVVKEDNIGRWIVEVRKPWRFLNGTVYFPAWEVLFDGIPTKKLALAHIREHKRAWAT